MKEGYFINVAFTKAIQSYLASYNNKDGILYNSFQVVVIRILALIYGRLDLLNPYYLNNSVVFFNNLAKYGMNRSDLAMFKEEFLNYYQFELEYNTLQIKKCNPYFKTTLKYLIDMFVAKKKSSRVSYEEEEQFLDLIYTTHTKNPYRISYGYFMLDDLMHMEKYYYSKINEMDMTREIDMNHTIHTNLNLEALNIMGVGLTHLENMDSENILQAKNDAYHYFAVDASSPNREEELQQKVDYYKMYGKHVTTGNGYVDILLLMSVIATSFSVLIILIFSFM